jgi:hypothetical protein
MTKHLREILPLDETKKLIYKKKNPRADVKTKGDITKEKSGRAKLIRAAGKEAKETGDKVKFQSFGDWRRIRASAKRKIQEAKSEYSKTKKASGEGEREHFYVDMGRRAQHVRDLKDQGVDARHEYSPYSNLSGLSVPKKHAKKVSEFLWPKGRKK